jgi:hypothetical protein
MEHMEKGKPTLKTSINRIIKALKFLSCIKSKILTIKIANIYSNDKKVVSRAREPGGDVTVLSNLPFLPFFYMTSEML